MPYGTPAKQRAYNKAYAATPARRAAQKARKNARKQKERHARPDVQQFVAIDSEGFSFQSENCADRTYHSHKTFLWGAATVDSSPLWLHSTSPLSRPALSSIEIFEWLLSLPQLLPKSIFVSFAFSYDATQAMADLPYEVAYEIQRQRPYPLADEAPAPKKGSNATTFWRDYAISYIKGKKFALYKMHPDPAPRYVRTKQGKPALNYIHKIIIYDVYGFFQKSFLQSCEGMPGAVTPAEYEILFSGKRDRIKFQPSDLPQVIPYTTAELHVLCRMMNLLRDAMLAENISIRQWFGAGSIASALLARENVKNHFPDIFVDDLPEYQTYVHHAFFGGRIELLMQGATSKPLFGYDISSAYPAEAWQLPSMAEGTWRKMKNLDLADIRAMSPVSMVRLKTHDFPDAPFYPFPWRDSRGSIFFPRVVHGIYMVAEVLAGFAWLEKYGASFRHEVMDSEIKTPKEVFGARHFVVDCVPRIELLDAWEFVPSLASAYRSAPFAFIKTLFDYRASLPKSDIKQQVIKLGINACYGKLAQKIGSTKGKPPTFANPYYAAAITAGTRAKLLQASLASPDDIVMLATDGIVSSAMLPISCPPVKTLGAWESERLANGGVFVQSGVYVTSNAVGVDSSKTRGFNPKKIGGNNIVTLLRKTIPALWDRDAPSLDYPYHSYMTLGASVASRELYAHIGQWVEGTRTLDLRRSGVKRDVSHLKTMRRRRAKTLLPSQPAMLPSFISGETLSAQSIPDWLEMHPDRDDDEDQRIVFARYA